MIPESYPNLSFRLENGRTITVHAFIWEPSYSETTKVQDGDDIREVTIERKRVLAEKLIGNRKTYHFKPKLVDQYFSKGHPPRIQNTAMTALLSSSPMSEEALYSELVVIFFMDHVQRSSIESMLEREMHDFDWEKHAEDVFEWQNELWKEVWVEKTVH